jgi:hypothetical protein
MGNDISIVCRAAVVALAVFAAGCHSSKPDPVPEQAPPEAAAPEAAPVEEAAAPAETVELKQDAPLRYVVQKGDTLWGIANKFLKDSWQWPEVWYVNPKVKNPHLIYPGDELYLYFVNGAPQIAKGGEGPPNTPAAPADALPPGGLANMTPHAREEALSQAIYAIPLEKIRAFLHGPRLVDEDELDKAPYLVDFEKNHLMAGSDETAYVLKLEDQSHALWQIVRKGEKYKDPDDNDTIGYEVLPVADTEVRAYGKPSTVYIRRSYLEALAGDYLIPMEQDPLPSRFIPHGPAKDVDGKIISVYNGMSQIGQYQVVAINRGTSQGMDPGTVLTVYQSGRKSEDPHSFFGRSVKLPDINSGTVMVFKTSERMSLALVMNATREIHLLDKVEKPASGN